MFFGQVRMTRPTNREHRSQRLFWALILGLIVVYGVVKTRHIALAFEAYQDQPLMTDTTGAAK